MDDYILHRSQPRDDEMEKAVAADKLEAEKETFAKTLAPGMHIDEKGMLAIDIQTAPKQQAPAEPEPIAQEGSEAITAPKVGAAEAPSTDEFQDSPLQEAQNIGEDVIRHGARVANSIGDWLLKVPNNLAGAAIEATDQAIRFGIGEENQAEAAQWFSETFPETTTYLGDFKRHTETGDTITQEILQFALPFAGYMKAFKALGAGNLMAGVGAEAATMGINFDPHFERFVNIARELGVEGPVIEYLADTEGSDGLNRAKNIVDSLIATGALGGAVVGGKVFKEIATALGDPEFRGQLVSNMIEPRPRGSLAMQRGMVAFHGTPHKFDKFSLEAIGTGEGAQAYGWGLYFAGKRDIAEYYRDALSAPAAPYNFKGKPVNKVYTQEIREEWADVYDELYDEDLINEEKLAFLDGVPEELQEQADDAYEKLVDLYKSGNQSDFAESKILEEFPEGYQPDTDQLYDMVEGDADIMDVVLANLSQISDPSDIRHVVNGFSGPEMRVYKDHVEDHLIEAEQAEGSLFQVDIPEDDELLDWDLPLSEQPESVKESLKAFGIGSDKDPDAMSDDELFGALGGYEQTLTDKPASGAKLYQELVSKLGSDKAASHALHEAGIPGLRYSDGPSRNKPLNQIKKEFLEVLPEDADIDEVSELIGTGHFSAENEAFLSALAEDDWLGFEYAAQAVSAALGGNVSNWDPSPELMRAIADLQKGGTHNYVIWDEEKITVEAVNDELRQAEQMEAE